MVIDWGTVLPVVLGIFSTVAGALALRSRAQMKVLLDRAQIDLQRVQVTLQRTRNEASRFDQLMTLINNQGANLQQQIQINQAFSAGLQQVATANEQNYQVLRQVWDRQTQEIMENSKRQGERVIERVDALPAQITAMNMETLRTITAEIGVMLAEVVRQGVTHWEASQFPPLRDRRWVEAYIHPLHERVYVFDEPRFQEAAQGLDAYVRGEERAWVIEEAAPGFHAVRRSNGTYGFIQMSAVVVVPIGNHYPKEEQGEQDISSSGNGVSGGSSAGASGDTGGSPPAPGRGVRGGGSRTTGRGEARPYPGH